MKNLKSLALGSLLTLGLTVGGVMAPVTQSHAGIIVIAATNGIAGPLIGLSITAAGFFWGIQDEGLNWKAAALFVLDNKLDESAVENALAARYPDLDKAVASEIAALVMEKSAQQDFNSAGQKEIKLTQDEFASIEEMLNLTNPELVEQLKRDLTH